MALLALRKLQIEMFNWHDKGWTMFYYFQCISADEHNASMQLARESFMVAVQKKETKWKITFPRFSPIFAMLLYLFPPLQLCSVSPQHISPIATILQFPPPPRTICDLRFSVGWTGNTRKPKPARYYFSDSEKYTGNTHTAKSLRQIIFFQTEKSDRYYSLSS